MDEIVFGSSFEWLGRLDVFMPIHLLHCVLRIGAKLIVITTKCRCLYLGAIFSMTVC